ncbi:MAG: membrane protein insertase YidC [Calditrichaceae bacterium]|jgi:YidC/Oxa1 family membrane protein insertase
MDKKTVMAMVIIAVIIILMPYYQKLLTGDQPVKKTVDQKTENVDTVKKQIEKAEEKPPVQQEKPTENITEPVQKESKFLTNAIIQDSAEHFIDITSNKIKVRISNKGGGNLESFKLLNYDRYDSTKVNMIDKSINNDVHLSFQNPNGEFIETNNYLFKNDQNISTKFLREGESFKIKYTLEIDNEYLEKTLIFYDNLYHFDVVIKFSNPSKMILNRSYEFGWQNGLPPTEPNFSDDYNYSQAYVYMGEELDGYQLSEPGKKELVTYSGSADWLAVRTKYFITALMHKNADVSEGIYFSGEGIQKQDYVQRLYDFGYNVNYQNNYNGDTLRVYIGPLDISELDRYHNELDQLVMNNGWYEHMFRFISLIILQLLQFFHSFIPNYGIVIIIFSILIKVVLYPLTKKSYSSMKDMQKIQPLMTEIREKYKDEPQRMNSEMMKLYKEHGVNPVGGCLPMILQMPLLIALFIVFRSTIQLRGAMFIPGWITDLSQPDTLFLLPFSLPMYGNEFNILPILMALTMIFQSKMTMQDPKQKMMVYIMPIFMLLIFNRFPSGLNLYYTLFNLFTIVQQKFISTGSDKEPDLTKTKKIKGKN